MSLGKKSDWIVERSISWVDEDIIRPKDSH